MSMLELLKQAGGGQGLGQLASQLGMDEGQAGGLAEMLAPAIGSAAKRQAESGGLDALLGQLKGEAQSSFFDNPAEAVSDAGRAQGSAFLEQLMGGQSQTQQLAQAAAERTGVDASQVEQFLPGLAAMLQGGMQRQMPDNAIQGLMGGGGGGGLMGMLSGLMGGGAKKQGMGMLMSMLDRDGDGSPLDDILDMAMKR